MSVIKWELNKIFTQKSLYVVAILFFGLFTFSKFVNTYETEITQKAYKEWEGPFTEEKKAKAKKLNAELQAYFSKEQATDKWMNAQAGVVENIEYGGNIQQNIIKREKDLKKLIAKAKSQNDQSLVHKLQLQKDMYGELKIDKLSYHAGPVETVDFVNVYGLILTGIFLLVGLAGVYSAEHSSGVENYILSTKNGRTRTMMAKLVASSIFAIVTVLTWEVFNLLTNLVLYGTKGWDLPIQYSFKYFMSPYSLTFTEYHVIQLAFHLLGAMAFSGMMVVISTLARSTVISFFVSGFLFGIPVFLDRIVNTDQGWIKNGLRYTLTNIMKVEGFFMNFSSVNVFGYPVLAPYIGVAFSFVVLILSVILARYLMIKKQLV